MAVLTLLGGLALVAAPPLVGVPTNDGDFGRYVEPVVVADPTLLPFAPGVGDRSAQYLSTSANGTRGDRSGLVWGPAASPPTPFINPRGNRDATGVYTPTTANGTRGDRAGLVWGSPTVAPTPFINQRGNRSTEYRFNAPRGDRAPGPPVQQRVVQNFPFFTSLTLAPPPPPPPPPPVQLSFQLDPFDVIGAFSTLVLSSFAMTALGFVTYTGALTAAMSPFALDAAGNVSSGAVTGTLDAACSPFAFAATGTETFTGTLTAACSPFAFAATGAVILAITGTVSAAASPFACAVVGTQTFTGALTATLSPFALDAIGVLTFTGALTATLSPFALDAIGVVTFTFTGTFSGALSPFALDATGLYGSAPPPFCRGLADVDESLSLVFFLEPLAFAIPIVVSAPVVPARQIAVVEAPVESAVVLSQSIRAIVVSC